MPMPSRQRQSADTSSGRDGVNTSSAPAEKLPQQRLAGRGLVLASVRLDDHHEGGAVGALEGEREGSPEIANAAPSRNSDRGGQRSARHRVHDGRRPRGSAAVEGDDQAPGLRWWNRAGQTAVTIPSTLPSSRSAASGRRGGDVLAQPTAR